MGIKIGSRDRLRWYVHIEVKSRPEGKKIMKTKQGPFQTWREAEKAWIKAGEKYDKVYPTDRVICEVVPYKNSKKLLEEDWTQ